MGVDMFLEFDKSANIKGESIDKKFKDMLQIDSYDFGAELPTSTELGTGLTAGKVKFNEFNFKLKASLASASCFKNMYLGTHIPLATLHLRKSGGGPGTPQLEYQTIKFKELVINKWATDGGSEDPTESISFAFTALYLLYNQQDQTGKLVDKRECGWNVKENDEWLGT